MDYRTFILASPISIGTKAKKKEKEEKNVRVGNLYLEGDSRDASELEVVPSQPSSLSQRFCLPTIVRVSPEATWLSIFNIS